jgi:hypothetical protein
LNEWLKLMLDEIRRKQRERDEARRERERRGPEQSGGQRDEAGPPRPANPSGTR